VPLSCFPFFEVDVDLWLAGFLFFIGDFSLHSADRRYIPTFVEFSPLGGFGELPSPSFSTDVVWEPAL